MKNIQQSSVIQHNQVLFSLYRRGLIFEKALQKWISGKAHDKLLLRNYTGKFPF